MPVFGLAVFQALDLGIDIGVGLHVHYELVFRDVRKLGPQVDLAVAFANLEL